jgi:transcriptional antiterminator Rof (Rho-off)
MTDYRPIDCDLHSRYEEAIVLRRLLQLRWHTSEGSVRDEVVKPLDILASAGEEFLIVRDAGHNELRLRLDYILSATAVEIS